MWLVGAMGTGKSTVGRLAAAIVGVPFHDTDLIVEADAGTSVAEIWETEGEVGFRRRETAAMRSVAKEEGFIATGGGAVLEGRNREVMAGTVVWLRAGPRTILRRLGASRDRPLLDREDPGEALLAIMAERAPIYERLASCRIDTDTMTVDEAAERVARLWPS